MSAFRLGLLFGVDEAGPWAALDCSAEGCEVHESVRPFESFERYDETICALFEFAQRDGWLFAGGAWCPMHAETGR